MKRLVGLVILTITFLAPAMMAQQEERGEIGVYADYTRLTHANNANFWGPGASVAFNLRKWVQLEGNFGYQPAQTITFTGLNTISNGLVTNSFTSNIRLVEGMFGPKFQTGVGPVKAYFVLKGGLLNFNSSNRNGGVIGLSNAVSNIASGDTNGVFYPGGGVEFGMRHGIGIRAEVGDLMYIDRGANHNLKFMIGPTFSW